MIDYTTDEYITKTQKNLIIEMIEFSDYPLAPINIETATKKEASNWINKNWKLAHERTDKFGFY